VVVGVVCVQFRSWCKNLFKLLSSNMSRKSGPWSIRGIGLMFTQVRCCRRHATVPCYAPRHCHATPSGMP
jgi:hypothetical protein